MLTSQNMGRRNQNNRKLMLTSHILGRQHQYLQEHLKKDLTTAVSGGIFVT